MWRLLMLVWMCRDSRKGSCDSKSAKAVGLCIYVRFIFVLLLQKLKFLGCLQLQWWHLNHQQDKAYEKAEYQIFVNITLKNKLWTQKVHLHIFQSVHTIWNLNELHNLIFFWVTYTHLINSCSDNIKFLQHV